MVRETAILWNTSFRDPGRKKAEKGQKKGTRTISLDMGAGGS
jgi:hypothetical protein